MKSFKEYLDQASEWIKLNSFEFLVLFGNTMLISILTLFGTTVETASEKLLCVIAVLMLYNNIVQSLRNIKELPEANNDA